MSNASTSIDPYAPPKTSGENYLNSLDENGYAYKGKLVTNQSFVSPLICVKLGIPIPESKARNQLKSISIKGACEISFYLSEKYSQKRKRHLAMCLTILVAYILMSVIVSNSDTYRIKDLAILFPLILIVLTVFIYRYNLVKVKQTKDLYHIKGVHKNLLQSLPPLPK